MDTGARSVWMDEDLFWRSGGRITSTGGQAVGVDGSSVVVVGTGSISDLRIWGAQFQDVRGQSEAAARRHPNRGI